MSIGAVLVFRWGFFAVCLWLLVLFMNRNPQTKIQLPPLADRVKAFLIGFVLVGPAHQLYLKGITLSSTTETAVLNLTSPIWTGLLAVVLLKERVTSHRWTAILVALAGAYCVSIGFRAPEFHSQHDRGNLIYLGAVFAETLAMLLAIPPIRRSSGMGVLVFQVSGVATAQCLAAVTAISQFTITRITLPAALSIAYLALVAGCFCFVTWFKKVEKAPISLMVTTIAVQGPCSALIGHYANGETLTVGLYVGMALIVASLLIVAADKVPHVDENIMEPVL